MIGRVGTILGDAHVNISTMQVSRNTVGGDAIMVLSTDRAAGEATLAALRVGRRDIVGTLARRLSATRRLGTGVTAT